MRAAGQGRRLKRKLLRLRRPKAPAFSVTTARWARLPLGRKCPSSLGPSGPGRTEPPPVRHRPHSSSRQPSPPPTSCIFNAASVLRGRGSTACCPQARAVPRPRRRTSALRAARAPPDSGLPPSPSRPSSCCSRLLSRRGQDPTAAANPPSASTRRALPVPLTRQACRTPRPRQLRAPSPPCPRVAVCPGTWAGLGCSGGGCAQQQAGLQTNHKPREVPELPSCAGRPQAGRGLGNPAHPPPPRPTELPGAAKLPTQMGWKRYTRGYFMPLLVRFSQHCRCDAVQILLVNTLRATPPYSQSRKTTVQTMFTMSSQLSKSGVLKKICKYEHARG